MIYGNTVGGGGGGLGKTFIIEDSEGNELVGILTDSEVVIDATPNDIRAGKIAVTQNGVITGEKEIPVYHTWEGFKLITNGSKVVITTVDYDYEKLQAIICSFGTSLSTSTSAQKVAINNKVYPVQSTVAESAITKDDKLTQINFGVVNNSGTSYVLRYFMYKEIY